MEKHFPQSIPTGVPGFDDILRGGLTAGRVYLVSGGPGAGKTTFSLQFLATGIRKGESCLYIAVTTSPEDIAYVAESLGISLDPTFFCIHKVEISQEILEGPERRIFHPSETELAGALQEILAEVRRVKPKRVVIDSLSDLRLLSEDPVSYRRLILGLWQEFGGRECTVIMTNYGRHSEMDLHLETLSHGVIYFEQETHGYGPARRRLQVVKHREKAYRSGWHDFTIVEGGITVFPTLIPGEHREKRKRELIPSGNVHLDDMLCGGLNRGSSTAIMGASGTGKTTLANLYAVAAARRGEHAVVYLFGETDESFLERAEGMGLAVERFMEQGLVTLRQVDVAEFSPGQFIAMIRREVEERDARVIVIDTLSGYGSAMPDERYLTVQLHELLTYLTQKGVTVILTVEQHGIVGDTEADVKDVSYLADTILLLRFFEHRGTVRRAISVIKKRRGRHETTIRELTLTENGVVIGEPLTDMHGVLTGVPTLER